MRKDKTKGLTRLGISFLLVFSGILVLSGINSANATAPVFNPIVKVATNGINTGGVAPTTGSGFGQVPYTIPSCYINGDWFVFYMKVGSTTVLEYVYSTDGGVTFSAAADFTTFANSETYWAVACFGVTITLSYNFGGSINNGWIYKQYSIATPASPSLITAETTVGGISGTTTTRQIVAAVYDSGGNFVLSDELASNGTSELSCNGTLGCGGIFHVPTPSTGFSGGSPIASSPRTLFQTWSANTASNNVVLVGTTSKALTGLSTKTEVGTASVIGSNVFLPVGTGAGTSTQPCSVYTFSTSTLTYTSTIPTGLTSVCNQPAGGTTAWFWSGSDGVTNVWMIFPAKTDDSQNFFVYSSNAGSTFTVLGFTPIYQATQLYMYAFTQITTVTGGGLQAMAVYTDAAGGIYTQIFSLSPTSSASSQTQTIGSCPTKNTATFTMVNSTLYFYYGTTPGQGVVNTISLGVSSIGGATGTHTLGFYIYAAQSPGPISGSNQLVQAFAFTHAFTSGSTHFVYNLQVAGSVIPSGVIWGVGVVGDNKIVLNQSALSGLYTQAGVASNAVQSAFFTTQGTSVATELYLCSTLSYATSSTTTVTTTTTSFTTSAGSTTTTTVTSLNQAALITGSVNFSVLLLIILGPTFISAAVFGAIAKSGVAALGGGAIGMGLGAAIGNVTGLVPLWIVGVLVLFIIFVIVLALTQAGDRGGG